MKSWFLQIVDLIKEEVFLRQDEVVGRVYLKRCRLRLLMGEGCLHSHLVAAIGAKGAERDCGRQCSHFGQSPPQTNHVG